MMIREASNNGMPLCNAAGISGLPRNELVAFFRFQTALPEEEELFCYG